MKESIHRAVECWHQGWTLSDIARECGVSRQWISQLAINHPELFSNRNWASANEIGQSFAIDPQVIRRWARNGLISIAPSGLLAVDETEDLVLRILDRVCGYPGCNNQINTINIRQRFCTDCSAKVQRYRYPVMDHEERDRARQAAQRWAARNPDRAKEIRRRAQHAYRERQRKPKEATG